MSGSQRPRRRRAAWLAAAALGVPAATASVVVAASSEPVPVTNAVLSAGDIAVEFRSLEDLTSEVELVDSQESGEQGPVFGRFLGRAEPISVTLRGPMSVNAGLETWHAQARLGQAQAFKDATLTFHDENGAPTLRYHLANAVPTKVELAGSPNKIGEVIYRTVVLSADEVTRVP